MSEPSEVMQVKPEKLQPHEKNKEIYNDTNNADDLDDTFLQSIKQKGVLQPLVVTDDNTIISGHRRWIAAKDADLDTIPVTYDEFDTDLAKRKALIDFNRQREKTPGQIVNEFEEMVAIEEERAKERKGERTDLKDEPCGNVSTKSREKAAEKINADVSGRTIEKGKKVKDKATSDNEPKEVREAAQDAWNDLQSDDESFSGAYQNVKQAEKETEEKQEREKKTTNRKESFTSSDTTVEVFHGDFQDVLSGYKKSIDHIITDPPYDADAIELWESLGQIAADILPDGGFLIAYSGKAHLPAVHDVLSDNLNYYWQGIVRHHGPGAKIFSRKLRTGYKPILIYQKGELNAQESFVSDVIEGDGREKDDHDWQQAEAETAELLDRFTNIDDRILDPMCGSGTVGVSCQRLQRKSVLIDNDADAIRTARKKCEDVSND